jgi:hypothetical protein
VKRRWPTLATAAAVLLAGTAAVAVALPADADDGGLVVHRVEVGTHPVTVVVAPGRPGRNVVQVASPHGVEVTTPHDVDLDAGSNTITVTADGATLDVPIEVDGPRSQYADDECAAQLLGQHVAGRRTGECAPPAAGDASRAAAALVRHAQETRIAAVHVVADDTPRGRAARAGAEEEARRLGLRLDDIAGPEAVTLLAGSWSQTATVVRDSRPGRGFLAAPWLLSPAITSPEALVTVATTLAPQSAVGRAYAAALAEEAPGLAPTSLGLDRYAGSPKASTLQLWTAANVQFLPRALSAGHAHSHGATASWVGSGQLALVRSSLAL